MSKEQTGENESGATLSSLLEDVVGIEPVTSTGLGNREADGRAAILQAHASGLLGLYKLRERWSPYLIRLLVATTVFQMVLVIFVGFGWWKFEKNEVFLNTVAAELFLQVAGMCLVLVKCLFPSNVISETEAKGKKEEPPKK